MEKLLQGLQDHLIGTTVDQRHPRVSAYYRAVESFLAQEGFPIKTTCQTLYITNTLPIEVYEKIVEVISGKELYISSDQGHRCTLLLVQKVDQQYLVDIAGQIVSTYGGFRDALVLSFHGITEPPEELIDKMIEVSDGQLSREPLQLDSMVPVAFAAPGQSGVDITFREFPMLPFGDIERNYTATVQSAIRELIPKLQIADKGLVTIHGPSGSGKTFLLRALMTEIKREKHPLVCIPPSEFLSHGQLLTGALGRVRNPLVIFEDLGDLFEVGYRGRFSDAFSTFVNFADGLLSLLHGAVFVLTFNDSIDKMDSAMIRPGRCIGNIEVPNLSYDEALELLPEDKQSLLVREQTSLAHVYDLLGTSTQVVAKKSKGTLGFQTNEKSMDSAQGQPSVSYGPPGSREERMKQLYGGKPTVSTGSSNNPIEFIDEVIQRKAEAEGITIKELNDMGIYPASPNYFIDDKGIRRRFKK